MRTHGFTLIEILIVLLIFMVLFAVAAPLYFSARRDASNSAALIYANNVYKIAYSHVAQAPGNTVIETSNCMGGYEAGAFRIGEPPKLNRCEVSADNNLPRVVVEAESGKVYSVP